MNRKEFLWWSTTGSVLGALAIAARHLSQPEESAAMYPNEGPYFPRPTKTPAPVPTDTPMPKPTATLAKPPEFKPTLPPPTSTPKAEVRRNPENSIKYHFLNGGCLIANNHELLFLPLDAVPPAIGYASNLGAKVIRVFCTDASFDYHFLGGPVKDQNAPEIIGQRVGERIAQIAPWLRGTGIKLIAALANNHRPVPGEKPEAFVFFDKYDQLSEAFYTTLWQDAYARYANAIIRTVVNLGAKDVIFAWEPVNEGHTPYNPPVFLNFFKEVVGFIRAIDNQTMIAPGTMGINHLEPGRPDSPAGLEFYRYLHRMGNTFITLHAYDLRFSNGQVTSAGDMPIHWDMDLLNAHPEIDLPIIVEEIGTSREAYSNQDERLEAELETIRYLLDKGAWGFGPWSATNQAKYGDTRRGPTSFDDGLREKLEQAYKNLPRRP